MTNVCTHAGLSSNEKRLVTPAKKLDIAPLLGEGLRDPSGEEGGESRGAGSRVFERVFRVLTRPDSSTYGDIEDRRRPILRASSSFSSNSISTSLISSLTPCSGRNEYPSLSNFAPKNRNNEAAKKFVKRLGMSVGTACPSTAERMVMTIKAEKAPEKTISRGCFIAIRAAIRKVLSPISEKTIIARERTKECNGCMRDAGAESKMGIEGVKGFNIARGSVLEALSGTGSGMSCGLSGRSAGFCMATC